MKTPINGKTLRQHLTYAWWKYALVIVLGALAVNLYFTVTTYRSPEDKKIEMYVYGLGNDTALQAYMDEVREEQMSDMEEMRALLMTTDATYGPMQLSTYVGAGEGDIYVLPRDQFISLASSGAWLPLEENEELISLFTDREISLQSGWRRESESGISHLYGIPVSKLPGLQNYLYVENGYISLLVTGGNDENAMKFLRILCQDMIENPSPTENSETAAPDETSESNTATGSDGTEAAETAGTSEN